MSTNDGPAEGRIAVRVPLALRQECEAWADKTGMGLATYTRSALESFNERQSAKLMSRHAAAGRQAFLDFADSLAGRTGGDPHVQIGVVGGPGGPGKGGAKIVAISLNGGFTIEDGRVPPLRMRLSLVERLDENADPATEAPIVQFLMLEDERGKHHVERHFAWLGRRPIDADWSSYLQARGIELHVFLALARTTDGDGFERWELPAGTPGERIYEVTPMEYDSFLDGRESGSPPGESP